MVVNSVADVETIAVMMQLLISVPGQVHVDIWDVRAVLKNSGLFYFGVGTAGGKDRCIAATQAAIEGLNINPINIIVVVSSSQEYAFTIGELTEVNNYLGEKFSKCDLIWGNNTDDTLDKKVRVSVLLGSKR
jgi:cell division GTPase FtsZ